MRVIITLLNVVICISAWSVSGFISAETVVEVETIKPRVTTWQEQRAFTGSVEAVHRADLAVQQAGLISYIGTDVGATVAPGDVLLRLDTELAEYRLDELSAQADAARVERDEAQRLYDEVLRLKETKAVAASLIAERKAKVGRAEAGLRSAISAHSAQKAILTQHQLRAPFAGVITTRAADIGEWATPQTSVLSLVSNQNLRVRVAIPQDYLHFFQSQQPVVTVFGEQANNREPLTLPLSGVVPVSDRATRTFIVLVDLPVQSGFVAGMSAQVTFALQNNSQPLIWLPDSALKHHPDGGYSVFAVEEGALKRFLVSPQRHEGSHTAVTGIPAELHYVAKGVETLREGVDIAVKGESGE